MDHRERSKRTACTLGCEMTFLVICRAITFRLVRTDIYPRSMAAIAVEFSRSGRYRRTDDDDPVHSLIDRTLTGRQNDEDCAPWPSSSADWISELLTSYCCSAACDLAVFPSTTACTGTVSPLCYVLAAYQPSANPSAPPHVVLEGIYISGS